MTPALRLLALVLWTIVFLPVQAMVAALNASAAKRLPMRYHQGVLRILGIEIQLEGQMRTNTPTLIVSNHISYLDIFVLGAAIQGSFVAKAEIAGWPVAGYMARLQRSIFVERERRGAVGEQRDMLQQRFDDRENVILFPEGTSYDGARVLPFKSALFAAAERKVDGVHVSVQPLSIAYVEMDGLPLTRAQRSNVAWYGDMALLPHLWAFARSSQTRVVLNFHPPVTIDDFGNRRRMASACHQVVASSVTSMVMGRPAVPAPVEPARLPA